ncbi:hypothetical protein HPB47_014301, partial [Ixodes persulcatus]
REQSSKYYVSKEECNGAKYPPFVAGDFYVLDGSILRRLYDASKLEPFFLLEDVSLTGFVAKKAVGASPDTVNGRLCGRRKRQKCLTSAPASKCPN